MSSHENDLGEAINTPNEFNYSHFRLLVIENELEKFKVTKCAGIGSYSDVFKVIACENADANE